MDIDQLLREEIESELSKLEEKEVGTEEHKAAVDTIVKLTDRVIDFKKISVEDNDKYLKRVDAEAQAKFDREMKEREIEVREMEVRFEQEFKLKQATEERKDRITKNCIAVAGIVVPTVVTIWGTKRSFEFEKEGTITTIMGRGFINKLLPKK